MELHQFRNDRSTAARPSADAGRNWTVEDLAARWHCVPQTVRTNRRKWGLKGFKFGKRLLFTDAEVEKAEKRMAEGAKL